MRAFLLVFAVSPAFIMSQPGYNEKPSWRLDRARIIQELDNKPGKHLVIVHYDDTRHNPHDEWVYNGADIDGSKIVWAREMDQEENRRLTDYFKDRHIWLLEADVPTPDVVPYPFLPQSR